jgi:hypothetical protein
MINMPHRPNIHMRLRPLKLRLTHHNLLTRRGMDLVFFVGSGGRTRTDDNSIMSRVL